MASTANIVRAHLELRDAGIPHTTLTDSVLIEDRETRVRAFMHLKERGHNIAGVVGKLILIK